MPQITSRPWKLLPAPPPMETTYEPDFFYNNVAKPLIADTVRIMMNGLPIDINKVEQLEKVLDETLLDVMSRLDSNPIILEFITQKQQKAEESYKQEQTLKMKTPEDFLKEFKPKDMVHRSFFMYCFSQGKSLTQPLDEISPGIPKWTAKDVRAISSDYLVLQQLLEGTISSTNKFVQEAVALVAKTKAETYNASYIANITSLAKVPKQLFNPGSAHDKHFVLVDMLGLESTEYTKAYKTYERDYDRWTRYGRGEEPVAPPLKYSWPRDVLGSLLPEVSDQNTKDLLEALMDYSMNAIIKQNFIPAFYKHTHNDRLFGNYTLLGAKTG